jgi:hypothetical protein
VLGGPEGDARAKRTDGRTHDTGARRVPSRRVKAADDERDPQLIGKNQQPVRISGNPTSRSHLDSRAGTASLFSEADGRSPRCLRKSPNGSGRSRRDQGASLFSEARSFVPAGHQGLSGSSSDGIRGLALFLRRRWVNLALPSGG